MSVVARNAIVCVLLLLATFILYRHLYSISNLSNQSNQYIMPSAQEFVDAKVKDGKVVVFSKSYCPFCKKTKETLKKAVKPDALEVIELESRSDCDAIMDYLKKITGGRTVPRVFIGGKSIGGNDDTQALVSSGKLGPMLKDLDAAL